MSPLEIASGPDLQPAPMAAPPVPGAQRWQVHVYAHTHWDREWYRAFERFRMQLVGVVDRLLTVLDSDPAFTTYVLDGQTIVLEDYLAMRPEEEPRLRRLVGAGRIEVGPWYVLPDEFLVSGESLVRNLLEGRRVAARFGEPLAVGYLPDPFGHVAQLPAVLRGFGIDNAIFSRGMGDEFARTGSEFRWESPSGADVLALVQLSPYTSGYCNAELFGRGRTGEEDDPYEVVRALVPYATDRARTDLLLLAAGCDHETVQEQLPAMVERVALVLPDADVRISGLDAAVATVRDAERRIEAGGGALERHRGELRGSLHAPILASIFSARVPLKQDNDRLQSLLERHVEPLMAVAVASGVRPARDVLPFLRHAWRLVLQNHPHDSIGGCSIDAVHEEMRARSLRADAVCGGLVEDLRTALGLGEVAVVHDAFGRGGVAERGDGSPVALASGPLAQLVEVEPLVRAGGAAVDGADAVEASGSGVRACVDADGGLRVRVAGRWIRLDWVDEADAGDEYDFGAVPGSEPLVATIDSWRARVAGPGVAELEVVHVLDLPAALTPDRRARSADVVRHEISTRVRVSDASPLAQLVVELDNRADDHRLRLRATPVDAADPTGVAALGHFAVIERPVRPAPTEVPWRQDPPALNHCAGAVRLVDPAGGVLLAGRGIHEYEAHGARPDGAGASIELTVLRSVGWLSREGIPGRPRHAGPALAAPGAQCRGPLRLDLAVGASIEPSDAAVAAFLSPPLLLEPFGIGQSQAPDDRAATTVPLESGAVARARDVLAVTPDDARARIAALGIELGGTGIVASACKLADDGSGDLVVRWWAPATARNPRARLRVPAGAAVVLRARLDETPQGPAPVEGDACEIAVKPGGIATLRIQLAHQ